MKKVKYEENGLAGKPFTTNDRLIRSGIASDDFGEMTPILWKGELLLLGSASTRAEANPYSERCLWIEDVATHEVRATFAEGYGLASAFVEDDTVYVYAIPNDSRGAPHIDCFVSSDLKSWKCSTVLTALPGEELFNESVCRAGDRYIMAYESRDKHYPPFTIYFAESRDLIHWDRIPGPVYGTDRYTACPSIRFVDGMFYMLYLEHMKPDWRFHTFLTRSADLREWEQSPRNPVLEPMGAEDINASDSDLVEYETDAGPVVRVYYATGNQKSFGTVTWADFKGTMSEFFAFYYTARS